MPKKGKTKGHRILFVINPISGNIEKSDLKDRIKAELGARSTDARFFETSGKDDFAKLKKMIGSEKPGIIVAAGGDGTANLAARAVLGMNIRIGFLPMGSANGIATELGVPNNLTSALSMILEGNEIRMDMLKINGKHYSVHLCDIGFNAHIIRRFEQQKKRGLLTYARMFLSELLRMKMHHYTITGEEGTLHIKAVMIVIANAGRYGTGAVINPRGEVNDGKFEIIILKAYRAWHILRMIIPVFTGNINRLRYVDSLSGRKFTIGNPELQDLHVDGEIVKPVRKITAEIVENALRVIVPGDKFAGQAKS